MKEHNKHPRSCGTHDGTFHADELTACALLALFNLIDEDKIIRTRDPKRLECCEYVCDVGGRYEPENKLFDHHQADYSGKLSSAGMILQYLKDEELINENEYEFFNSSLIKGVDDHDNGRAPQIDGLCSYSDLLASFVPINYDSSAQEQDKAFFQALDFVKNFLSRKLQRYQYIRSCQSVVAEAMQAEGDYLFFEKAIPWMEAFFELGGLNHPAQFVIMPTGEHWKLRGIPPSLNQRMDVRHPLPEKWAGLLDQELKVVTGISGAIFCHKGRFISVWETKEDALQALQIVLEKAKERL